MRRASATAAYIDPTPSENEEWTCMASRYRFRGVVGVGRREPERVGDDSELGKQEPEGTGAQTAQEQLSTGEPPSLAMSRGVLVVVGVHPAPP